MVMNIKRRIGQDEFGIAFANSPVISSENVSPADDGKTVFFMNTAYADDDSISLDYVVVCFSLGDLERINRVHELLNEHNIEEANIGFTRVYWGSGDVDNEFRLQNAQMSIGRNGWVWPRDCPKQGPGFIYGASLPLKSLVKAFERFSDGDLVCLNNADQSSCEDFMVKMAQEYKNDPDDACIRRVLHGLIESIDGAEDVLEENGLDDVAEMARACLARDELLALESPSSS